MWIWCTLINVIGVFFQVLYIPRIRLHQERTVHISAQLEIRANNK